MEPTQEPTEMDIGKMAVIIDCEGHIAITGSPKTRYHQLQVTIGSKDFVILDWCFARFVGAVYDNSGRTDRRGPRYAPAKRWRIQNRDASDLLERCLDHFIIKRKQAEIAIHFWKLYGPYGSKTSETDLLLCEQLRLELRALTKRGPRPTVPEPIKVEMSGNLFAN